MHPAFPAHRVLQFSESVFLPKTYLIFGSWFFCNFASFAVLWLPNFLRYDDAAAAIHADKFKWLIKMRIIIVITLI